jgi:hypothetical protein
MVALVLFAGCQGMRTAPADEITVEGTVTVRGNEPFTALILKTDSDNYYALDVTAEQRSTFSTPTRLRVTGALYTGEFQARPFARIRVRELSGE